jgi:hypothetical protein|uniref:Retrotransposon protein, putative, unclassified n=1 Tax=Oryza sativa subsp. japonica TaxID=39947 RepID=Q2QWQ4_ORYSJ|nr:retrotransposon protein, putative, unclassified [Oryza sativa Japonica Group]
MSYYVDPRTNGPQYPLYLVYGYPPSTVPRQIGELGAQGSTTMTSSLLDGNINPSINQGASTSTMLVWTQVGEIVFPVYTTMPISTGLAITGSENGVVTTLVDSMSKDPPAEAENGTSITSEPEKDPSAVKSCPSDKKHEPTRTTSEDDTEAEKITRQAKIYCMIGNDLYKKAPNGVLLKCISSNDGKHLLLNIHEEICGSHAGGWTLVGKAFRQGFFWPTTLKDACDMVQRCEAYQFHSKHTKFQRKRSRLSLSLGRSRAEGSIYSDHSHEDRVATSSYSWRSTSSLSGLKRRPQGKLRPTMPSSLSKGCSADIDCLTSS